MNESKFIWQERTSESEFIASVWTCSAPAATTRTVLADPCISIILIKGGGGTRVILRGPETKPRSEFLAAGYTYTTIRLQPGVLLRGFPVHKFTDRSLVLPAGSESQFWFEGSRLHFPDFDHAELLVDQLYKRDYLDHQASSKNIQAGRVLSPRTYFRFVKRTTGLSPYQLQQLQRMHRALRLLKQGVPTVTVATELNFVDQSHFTRASRQFLGHTPKQLLHLPQLP